MHNLIRIIALVLLVVVALNALAAGFSFMVETSGRDIGISTSYLRPWVPFRNFFVPGLVLFSVLGVGSLAVAWLTLRRSRHYPRLLVLCGAVWACWIAVQITMVTTLHPLHGIIGGAGLLLMGAGWWLLRHKTSMNT